MRGRWPAVPPRRALSYLLLKYLHVLGAVVILGTGAGIAFFMLIAHRSRDAAFIGRTAAVVVRADLVFTATAVTVQPVTGWLLMRATGVAFSDGWITASLALYAVAGAFWLPVVWIQARMRDLAIEAAAARPAVAAALPPALPGMVRLRHSRLRRGPADPLADDRERPAMSATPPSIVVLGASGLLGHAIASRLIAEGFRVVPIARRFSPAQRAALGGLATECPVVDLDEAALARLLATHGAELVVNCIGVLQDGPRGSAATVHGGFVRRLVQAMANRPSLLVHVSIPGRPEDDRTAFSTSKRAAEAFIAAGPVPFLILRPGFVIAPAAYGGSALVRALAALPVALPPSEAARPFATTDIADIARTIAVVATRWRDGARDWRATWDVMERRPATVGAVVDAFRLRFGGPAPRLRLPSSLMTLGARAGDLAARLGWSPPIRSTALAEMRRGVEGDPGPWIAATGIEPAALADTLARLPATVQEAWFARLYLAKPLILATLALFWIASGLIALTLAFDAAAAILTAHGFPPPLARGITIASSLADILRRDSHRISRDLPRRPLRRHRPVAFLPGGRGADNAGLVDRTARRAGQDRPSRRAHAGGARHPGRAVTAGTVRFLAGLLI